MNLFLTLRLIHILVAALWLGAAALLTLYIGPASHRTGAAGGSFIAETMRSGLPKFMAVIAGLTILSGLLLYWQWSELVGTAVTHSAGGIMLALGALAGIAAAIIGGAILAPTIKQLAELAAESSVDDARPLHIAALHQRMALMSKFALALLVTALVLMVMGHFG